MERRGAPLKLTRAVIDTILEAKRNGTPQNKAAKDAGIHRDTIRKWLHRGKNGEHPYDEFANAYYGAEKIVWDRKLAELQQATVAS